MIISSTLERNNEIMSLFIYPDSRSFIANKFPQLSIFVKETKQRVETHSIPCVSQGKANPRALATKQVDLARCSPVSTIFSPRQMLVASFTLLDRFPSGDGTYQTCYSLCHCTHIARPMHACFVEGYITDYKTSPIIQRFKKAIY